MFKTIPNLPKTNGACESSFLRYFNKDDEKELCREELEKVARFAKHHVPEQHEGDKAKYVEERINTLMQYQVSAVLNVIASSESKKVSWEKWFARFDNHLLRSMV